MPVNGYRPSYQIPSNGTNYCVYTVYNPAATQGEGREYIQNELKQNLVSGKRYCVTFWISLVNESKYAITEFGAYLDNGTVSSPYYGVANVTPQIKTPTGVFLTDTLSWIKVQGVYLANGTESHLTLGNFKTTASTSTLQMQAPPWPYHIQRNVADYYIDDVSIIETDLPAFAGADQYVIPGDSVYIGRSREIGLDDDCFWYQLPGMIPLDTAAGIWVKPVTTTTYVLKQDICGYISYDTVVVHQSGVGLNENSFAQSRSILYPNPGNGEFTVKVHNSYLNSEIEIRIFDIKGRIVLKGEKLFRDAVLNLNYELENGSYILEVKFKDGLKDKHKLVITK